MSPTYWAVYSYVAQTAAAETAVRYINLQAERRMSQFVQQFADYVCLRRKNARQL